MTLIDEREVTYEQERRKRIFRTIVKIIIILVILAIILLGYEYIKDAKTFKFYLDGKQVTEIDSGLILKDENETIIEENGEIYISTRKLANMLNYQYYNSEYKKKDEDKTKCQIKIENEYISFISNSNIMYKAIVAETDEVSNNSSNKTASQSEETAETSNVEFEYFTLNNNVKYVNDEIYASIQAIEIGFDVSISYNSKKHSLSISTLDYLENIAKGKRNDIVNSSEYDYINKRLLKYGMSIVQDSEGNIGVGSYTDTDNLTSFVASCKYTNIEFNEATKTLYTTTSNDNKKCVLHINLDSQEVDKTITSQYDDIVQADNNFEYFIIKEDDKYGVINSEGKIIIYPTFDEIGIDDSLYTGITNKYILNEKYIPVKQNGVWGLYNVDGEKLIEPQYANIGCSIAQCGEGVITIPGINDDTCGIVFLYNEEKSLYGLYNAETGEKIAISLVEVYRNDDENQENYYINYAIDKENGVIHTLNVYTDL